MGCFVDVLHCNIKRNTRKAPKGIPKSQAQTWESAELIKIFVADASQYMGGEFLWWMLLGIRRKFY